MPCFVSLGGYPCFTNHVEINDVCVGLYNAELLVGPGRKCALRELSLTNKNNIIIMGTILWIIAAPGRIHKIFKWYHILFVVIDIHNTLRDGAITGADHEFMLQRFSFVFTAGEDQSVQPRM